MKKKQIQLDINVADLSEELRKFPSLFYQCGVALIEAEKELGNLDRMIEARKYKVRCEARRKSEKKLSESSLERIENNDLRVMELKEDYAGLESKVKLARIFFKAYEKRGDIMTTLFYGQNTEMKLGYRTEKTRRM